MSNMMPCKRTAAALLTLAAAAFGCPPPAVAGGGALVVDDASVETPGSCHLESWYTRYASDRGLVNLSPACTRQAWPDLEIGAAFQHGWDGRSHTVAGPALKYNLRPVERGLGAAIDVAAGWDAGTGRLETASLVMPVTLPLSRRANFSVNVGYSYAHASAQRHSVFWGGQAEVQLSRDVGLMAEGFGRASGPVGVQGGLRWNPHGGAVDVDVLAGRYVDGASPGAITIGLTVRR